MSDKIALFIPSLIEADVIQNVLHDLAGVNIAVLDNRIVDEGEPHAYRWAKLSILNADDPEDPYALYLHHGSFDAEADGDAFPEGIEGTHLSMVSSGTSLTYLRLLLNQFGGLLTDDGDLREFAADGVIQRDMKG